MKDANISLKLVDEYNQKGHLIYLEDYPGAYVRGQTREQAFAKIPAELSRYLRWTGMPLVSFPSLTYQISQVQASQLPVEDADTGILFDSETLALSPAGYASLKALVLKSALDFMSLYHSIPRKNQPLKKSRKTFYGQTPVTAADIYLHTRGVNAYYFAGIGLALNQDADLLPGRKAGFLTLEDAGDHLKNQVFEAADGELWSLRKVCRRFIWHDTIHAKALYRSAVTAFSDQDIANPFCFLA